MIPLLDGVKRFQSEVFAAKRDLFTRLAHGQHPRALFITCSDSRIDPCMLTQTDPGDLFILRNAGNIVPSYGSQVGGTTATIEYAVGALQVRDVIVCGHTDCGVAKAILDPVLASDLPALRDWLLQVEATRRILKETCASLSGDALLTAAIQENVRVQLAHLRTHPLIAVKLRRGSVRLHGWVYSIATGDISIFDEKQEQFVDLRQVKAT